MTMVATECLWADATHSVEMLLKGTLHVLGRMKQKGARFYHTAQNSLRFKIYELLVSGISHFPFSNHG